MKKSAIAVCFVLLLFSTKSHTADLVQAQQILQTLSPQQQTQVQEALGSKEAIRIAAPDIVKPIPVAEREIVPTAPKKTKEMDIAHKGETSLARLYAKRAVQNPQIQRLISGEDTFFRDNVLASAASPIDMVYHQFGYNLFKGSSPDLAQSAAPVSEGYILGPGDALTVYLWGRIEEKLELLLDKTGFVTLPKSGPMQLSGVTFGESRRMIQQTLSKHFVNFDVQVVFKERRGIQVYLLGHVERPGAFQVPAGTRLTGLLYAAQGILPEGSLRQIQIRRNNRIIRSVDLYDYLLHGERRNDIVLENEDSVFVPPIGDTVLIGGTVSRPAIYEVLPDNTLADVVRFASGLTWENYYKRMQIYRIQNGEFQKTEDIIVDTPSSVADKTKQVRLRDGDIVVFHPIRNEVRNLVTLIGNVVRPGHYQWQAGMTVEALVARAQGVLPHTLPRVAVYRMRGESDTALHILSYDNAEDRRFVLREWDVVQFYSESAIRAPETVRIEGAVHHGGIYPLLQNMRLQDLLFAAKLRQMLRAPDLEVLRTASTGEVSLVEAKIDAKGQVSPNLLLTPRDEVRVKTLRDARIRVTISGEVAFPGEYVLADTASVQEIIRRAGGVNSQAYLPGAVFTRTKLAAYEDSGYEKVLRDEQKRLMYDQLQLVSFSEMDRLRNEKILEARVGYIQQLSQIGRQHKGRLVVDLAAIMAMPPGSDLDMALEDGDTLIIPKRPDYIQIVGGVESPATYQYVDQWDWQAYLSRAGGFSSYADKDAIKVFHADGTVSKLGVTLRPGDIVYVPEKIEIPFNWMFFFRSTVDVVKTVSDAVVSFFVLKGLATGFK